jgi:hypothetical protein
MDCAGVVGAFVIGVPDPEELLTQYKSKFGAENGKHKVKMRLRKRVRRRRGMLQDDSSKINR